MTSFKNKRRQLYKSGHLFKMTQKKNYTNGWFFCSNNSTTNN